LVKLLESSQLALPGIFAFSLPTGFTFFTNYESNKAKAMAENDKVSLTFYWEPLVRQVRVEGRVSKLPEAESEEYFLSRPVGSRVGAWASSQSQVIPGRRFLDDRVRQFEAKFGDDVPRPPHWGGYLVRPTSMEFWQGQSTRVHDRIRFRRMGEGEKPDEVYVHKGAADWVFERLAP
jgi:pyridoxamine 5'-phosphate oxidase